MKGGQRDTKDMRFSEYADDSLRQEYNQIIAKDYYPDYYYMIISKLLDSGNDLYMKSVWETLLNRAGERKDIGKQLFWDCNRAYCWEKKSRKTRREKKQELLAASKKARELADMSIYNDWAEILGFDAIREALDELNVQTRALPGLSIVLNIYAKKLEEEADITPTTAKPNAKNAHQIVFVRRLTASMREQFGQPLVATVAKTASVIFGEKINENFVRNNTRDLVPDCNGGGTK